MFTDNRGDQGPHKLPVDSILKDLNGFYQDLLNENDYLRGIVKDLRVANQALISSQPQIQQAFHGVSTAWMAAQQEVSSLKAGYTALERKLGNESALKDQVRYLVEDQARTIDKLRRSYDESDHLLELLQKCRVTRDIEKHGRERCEERIAEMEQATNARYSPFPFSVTSLPSMGTIEVLHPPVIPASSTRIPVLDRKGGKAMRVGNRDRANVPKYQSKIRKSSGGTKFGSRDYTRRSPDSASKITKRSLSAAFKQLDALRSNAESDTLLVQPQTGTMVGLPSFRKARSLRHAQNIMYGREASVERKYDGEYCQVHVRRQEGGQIEIKLFSKSGRDSTDDRRAIIPTIRQCLELDLPTCPMDQCCILVGELVVWDDAAQNIMPFYNIRRHIARAGRLIGCRGDSAPRPDEHLMIVFHDLLLWDDRATIYHTYEHRRQQLQQLLSPVPGQAVIGRHVLLDFAMKGSISRLACEMAYALSQRWEGLVLKAYRAPYITGDGQVAQHVKLKKDYIPGLGDSVDLLVIGGRSDPIAVKCLKLRPGSWTTFFLACQDAGKDLCDGEASVRFRLVGQVTPPSISRANIHLLNMHSLSLQMPFPCDDRQIQIVTELKGTSLPSHLFQQPAIVEVVGAGFDRPPNAQYLTLRFPRLVKVHSDRSARDVMSFAEYQYLARESMQAGDAQSEYRSWLCQLDYDSGDDLDEAATPSKSSQEELVDFVDAKDPIGSIAGIKRRREEDRLPGLSPTKRSRRETE